MCGCLIAGLAALGVAWLLSVVFGFHVAVIGLLVVIVAILVGSALD